MLLRRNHRVEVEVWLGGASLAIGHAGLHDGHRTVDVQEMKSAKSETFTLACSTHNDRAI